MAESATHQQIGSGEQQTPFNPILYFKNRDAVMGDDYVTNEEVYKHCHR